jgi:hypothetical protein
VAGSAAGAPFNGEADAAVAVLDGLVGRGDRETGATGGEGGGTQRVDQSGGQRGWDARTSAHGGVAERHQQPDESGNDAKAD